MISSVHSCSSKMFEHTTQNEVASSACSASEGKDNQVLHFPGNQWEAHSREGWSTTKLEEVKSFAATLKTSAYMVVQNGRVVDQYGAIEKPFLVHSVRKSFINALYGIQAGKHIDLSKTLGELGVDDNPPGLTHIEKQATLIDLLRSRSGIFHPAAYETEGMKASRPLRGSYPPGAFWYYNNWDFNALGAIIEKVVGSSIYTQLAERIAKPLQMEEFDESCGRYSHEPDSNYPAYDFFMSARDMARYGLLFLRNGQWGDQQVIPSGWVERSTTAYSKREPTENNPYEGYGMLWWIGDYGYLALGYGGHVIAVIPSKDLVIVHRVANDNDEPENAVLTKHFDKIIRDLIDAAP